MGEVDRFREWCMNIIDLDRIVTNPSEICAHSVRTTAVQLAFWMIVLSEFVSAVLGHRTIVTLAGTVVGGTIIAGVIFTTVTDR